MIIYNTLTKNKEEFIPQTKNKVKIYVCGPTVYDYAHIGNLRTYINTDFLRRWLRYSGYKIEEVMNITDIDDKTIKKSLEEKTPIKNVTQKYEKLFLEDLKKLNIEIPEKMPHATDNEVIERMIDIVQKLLDNGIAYKSDDGSVYLSVKRIKGYGKLSGVDLTGIKEGARVSQDEYDKENAQDFVLWKAYKEGEPGWDTPFGKGRPGWHIECSAMSTKYLGDTLDIHAGGVDLIFPHHENEIAQSESYTGKKFVNYWFHCEHLMIDGQRMGKSLNNFYKLKDLDGFGVEPLALRMLALMSHYRERLNFTRESIEQAQNTLNNLRDFVLKNIETESTQDINYQDTRAAFENALNDDLNTPKAISVLFDYIKRINIAQAYGPEVYKFILDLDRFMGLELDRIKQAEIPWEVAKLIDERERSRAKRDWELSDKLRAEIQSLGFEVEDTPKGPITKKV